MYKVIIIISVICEMVMGLRPLGIWRQRRNYKNEGIGGVKMNGERTGVSQFRVDDLGREGIFDHSFYMRVELPEEEPYRREWLLNYGQVGTGAHHWLYNPRNEVPNHGEVQFGGWNGVQVKDGISETTRCIVVTYEGRTCKYKMYVDGWKHDEVITELNIKESRLVVGEGMYGREANFSGNIEEVRYWDKRLSEKEALRVSACNKECKNRKKVKKKKY